MTDISIVKARYDVMVENLQKAFKLANTMQKDMNKYLERYKDTFIIKSDFHKYGVTNTGINYKGRRCKITQIEYYDGKLFANGYIQSNRTGKYSIIFPYFLDFKNVELVEMDEVNYENEQK